MSRPPLTAIAFPRPDAAAAAASRPKLGAILTARGSLSAEALDTCLKRQVRIQARLGDLLRADHGLSEAEIVSALEEQWSARRLDLQRSPPDPILVRALGLDLCRTQLCLPWRRIGGATVIAAVYPDRFESGRATYEALFGPVMLALTTEEELNATLDRLFPAETRHRSEFRLAETESCRSWAGTRFQTGIVTGLAGLTGIGVAAPDTLLLVLTLVAVLALAALTGLKAVAAVAAHAPARQTRPGASVLPLHPPARLRQPVVSLLVPLFREARIAERLLVRLGRLKYPKALLDVCLIVEADDGVTRACLTRTALPAHVRVIVVPPGGVRTKPRALNHALDLCHGTIVGVYDAEDAPDPDQIALVVTRFADAPPDVACLQGRLGFYNARQNWMARCFAIDYAIWFAVVLPGIARLGLPVPLGGTTLFFRREMLEALGGWDAHNVTEDADLGLRLARRGYRTELIDTTTLEEANAWVWPWIRQRSRWLKGYAMTYASHMRDPRRLWRDLGPRGFLGVQILFLGTLVQAVLAPVLWSWWLIALGLQHPLRDLAGPVPAALLILLLLASEAVNLMLAALALRRTGQRRLLPWALTLNAYGMLATFAALRGIAELAYRPFFWDKTEHGRAPEAGQMA